MPASAPNIAEQRDQQVDGRVAQDPEQRDCNATVERTVALQSVGVGEPAPTSAPAAGTSIHHDGRATRDCVGMALTAEPLDSQAISRVVDVAMRLALTRVELAALNLLPSSTAPRVRVVWHALLASGLPLTTRELALVVDRSYDRTLGCVTRLRKLGLVATRHGCHHAVDPRSGELAHIQAQRRPPQPLSPAAYIPGWRHNEHRSDRVNLTEVDRDFHPLPAAVSDPAREVFAELLRAGEPQTTVQLAGRLNKHRGNIDRALLQLRAVGRVITESHRHSPVVEPLEPPLQ